MRKITLIATFLLSTILQESLLAQTNQSILSYYDSELIQIGYNTFSGITLSHRNQLATTQFGIPQYFKDMFLSFEDTKNLVQSYSRLNLLSNILIYSGLAILILGEFVIFDSFDAYGDIDQNFPIGIAISIGGFVSLVTGSFILPASAQKLITAVNSYNRHKIEEYE